MKIRVRVWLRGDGDSVKLTGSVQEAGGSSYLSPSLEIEKGNKNWIKNSKMNKPKWLKEKVGTYHDPWSSPPDLGPNGPDLGPCCPDLEP
jgi:hypothetical protein